MKRADMQARLSATEKAKLLTLAYDAADAAVRCTPLPTIKLEKLSKPLSEPGASFVTITHADSLRGCIGTTRKRYPLARDVILRAASAATEDPRFEAIRIEELDAISIEVSVLTAPEPLKYKDPRDLPSLLTAGKDGVILHYGLQRATFLPQVWERVPDAQQFLDLLCRKAQLPDQAWRSGELEFETYQVESFQR